MPPQQNPDTNQAQLDEIKKRQAELERQQKQQMYQYYTELAERYERMAASAREQEYADVLNKKPLDVYDKRNYFPLSQEYSMQAAEYRELAQRYGRP